LSLSYRAFSRGSAQNGSCVEQAEFSRIQLPVLATGAFAEQLGLLSRKRQCYHFAMMELTSLRRRARRINRELTRLYPEVRSALHFTDPLQLLVSVILSAQCTDVRVNLVTPALFARFPDAASFASARRKELEKYIKSTGFFRNKAMNIIKCCKQLIERHGGQVPRTMEELVPLAGVGRKTANVVLGNAFEVPGIPVDTHVGRLSQRMGLTVHKNPVKIERDLMQLIPESEWTNFGHRMIFHGRQICHARRPWCEQCTLSRLCPKIGVKPPSEPEALAKEMASVANASGSDLPKAKHP
jgi:endonuclease-3